MHAVSSDQVGLKVQGPECPSCSRALQSRRFTGHQFALLWCIEEEVAQEVGVTLALLGRRCTVRCPRHTFSPSLMMANSLRALPVLG